MILSLRYNIRPLCLFLLGACLAAPCQAETQSTTSAPAAPAGPASNADPTAPAPDAASLIKPDATSSGAKAAATPRKSKRSKSTALKASPAAANRQLPSVSVMVSQQPQGLSAAAAILAFGRGGKAAVTQPPSANDSAANAGTAPGKPAPVSRPNAGIASSTPSEASIPPKPAATTKPPAVVSRPPSYGVVSESERLALSAMPLPKLPTLVPRETPATSIAAATAAAADIALQPAPGIQPSIGGESPTAAEIRSLLSKASERTGLSDAQLARIAQLEATATRGEQENALVGLLRLNDELDAANNSYTVGNGESLWQIAAKPETYGNANLWPLIWRANPKSLPQPGQVKSGQKLQMPRYPSLTAVTEALDYAGSHSIDKQ